MDYSNLQNQASEQKQGRESHTVDRVLVVSGVIIATVESHFDYRDVSCGTRLSRSCCSR